MYTVNFNFSLFCSPCDHQFFPFFFIIITLNLKVFILSTKNIKAFCDTLANSDWDFILEEKDVNKAYENFYSRINATADISFPLKMTKEKKINKAPWMTPSLKISKKYK